MDNDDSIKSVRDDLPVAFQPVYADSFRYAQRFACMLACMLMVAIMLLHADMTAGVTAGVSVINTTHTAACQPVT